MDETEITAFARDNLEGSTKDGGRTYRCAAVLNDGLYLPCVLLATLEPYVELALRRFDETRADSSLPEDERRFGYGMQYTDIVRSFVTGGNRLNHHDIAKLEVSRYAIPRQHVEQVRGETRMSWTQFTARMHDGREFAFGTAYDLEFFQMPEGYSGNDIISISSPDGRPEKIYRERPFFTCYVQCL